MSNTNRSKRLRVMVISTEGSDRQKHIKDLFAHPSMVATFEQPVFSPSVSSRALRNRMEFLRIANEAGLLPEHEWEAIRAANESGEYERNPGRLFDCLKDLPVLEGRRGSKADVKLHYCQEFWQKGKAINRGRSVLGCTLAHLIALKRFVEEDFDVMLEDNVRAPVETCAHLISQAREASERLKYERNVECHFRFVGWLGSTTNLEYLLQTHSKKRMHAVPNGDENIGVFPFPLQCHLNEDLGDLDVEDNEDNSEADEDETSAKNDKSGGTVHTKPGGNFIWGSYAYWISKTAYLRLLEVLRNDVGALLWKGKRARYYTVKPIDKVLPRQIMSLCGVESVQIATHPAFFRAPMLTSKIHVKWDPQFCKSTEYQLKATGLDWSHLWLGDAEREAVVRRQKSGEWTVDNPTSPVDDHF